MKAQEILAAWDAASPLFHGHSKQWLRLLRVAAAGPEGVRKLALWPVGGEGMRLKNWEKAGLVRLEKRPCGHQRGGNHAVFIIGTPKLAKLMEQLL